jgi:LysM repeat protein
VGAPSRGTGQGALTPAVLAASAFAMLAALAAVAFVTIRGGLELPVAATTAPRVAVVSPGSIGVPPSEAAPSPPDQRSVPSSEPGASAEPSAPPIATPAPSGPPDALAGLPPCPGHPGCHLYTVRRGDSYTAISDRYGVGLWIMDALNPQVAVKRLIVVGQSLYLGHDPTARLDPCPDASCHLYVVRAGDRLSAIAGRYGLSLTAIEALNPDVDPARIVAGQVIRLPLYQPA